MSKSNTNKIVYMNGMFKGCPILNQIILFKFNPNNNADTKSLVGECSEELKSNSQTQNESFSYETFRYIFGEE